MTTFGPFSTFPAVAADGCTRTPVDTAVELCPGLNFQSKSPWGCYVSLLSGLPAHDLFYIGALGRLVKTCAVSLIVRMFKGRTPLALLSQPWLYGGNEAVLCRISGPNQGIWSVDGLRRRCGLQHTEGERFCLLSINTVAHESTEAGGNQVWSWE